MDRAGRLRVVAVNLLLLALGAMLVDAGGRLFGVRPETIDPSIPGAALGARAFGRYAYPRGYFVAHDERGFDIAPDAAPVDFEFADGRTRVSSNRYGCFDARASFEGPYVLLVGDSFTWGYADYEVKWGTLLEEKIGVAVAKCGVTHTGQRHQLSKAKEVVKAIGHPPKIVVVAHYENDAEDDYLYPRATVFEGWLADAAVLEGGAPRRIGEGELAERYRRWNAGEPLMKNLGHDWDPPNAIERGSLLFAGVRRLRQVARARADRARALGGVTQAEHEAEAREANQDAMVAVKLWAGSVGAELRVLLVPPREMGDVYGPMRKHLGRIHVPFLDLLPRFAEVPRAREQLYWPRDRHFNAQGNRLVADLVAAWLAAPAGHSR